MGRMQPVPNRLTLSHIQPAFSQPRAKRGDEVERIRLLG